MAEKKTAAKKAAKKKTETKRVAKKAPAKKPSSKPKGGNDKAKKDEKPPRVEVHKYDATLRCPLTDEELLERSQQQARLLASRDAKESDMKAEMKHRKAIIEEEEAEMRRVAAEIRDRATYRKVDCERRFDYGIKKVIEVRLDTDDVVSERPMMYSELQRTIEFGDVVPPGKSPGDQITIAEADQQGAQIAAENSASTGDSKTEPEAEG